GRMETSYLFLENVRDAVSLYDIVNDATIPILEVGKILVQVFNALRVAWSLCRFTHYDLHGNNVLVRTLPEVYSVPIYETISTSGNSTILGYTNSRYLPYIIDYGFSYLEIILPDGTSLPLGSLGYESSSIYSDTDYPMHDVHR